LRLVQTLDAGKIDMAHGFWSTPTPLAQLARAFGHAALEIGRNHGSVTRRLREAHVDLDPAGHDEMPCRIDRLDHRTHGPYDLKDTQVSNR
jgi:hypothetical protein